MTDHRRRAEELYKLGRTEYQKPHESIETIVSALKEVEEGTWARAVVAVEKDNCGQFWQKAHYDAMREEAKKNGVEIGCCGHKACCPNKP